MFIPLQSLPIHRFKRSRPFEGLRNAEAAGILPSEYEASDSTEGEDEYGDEDYGSDSDYESD